MVLEFKDMKGRTDMTIHIGLDFKPPSPPFPTKSKNMRIIKRTPPKSVIYLIYFFFVLTYYDGS